MLNFQKCKTAYFNWTLVFVKEAQNSMQIRSSADHRRSMKLKGASLKLIEPRHMISNNVVFWHE